MWLKFWSCLMFSSWSFDIMLYYYNVCYTSHNLLYSASLARTISHSKIDHHLHEWPSESVSQWFCEPVSQWVCESLLHEKPMVILVGKRWEITMQLFSRQINTRGGSTQRRSQVSLAGGGGADRIPGGGGINLNTYSYGKRDRQPRGAQIFPGGAEPPRPPPPWLRAWVYPHLDFTPKLLGHQSKL